MVPVGTTNHGACSEICGEKVMVTAGSWSEHSNSDNWGDRNYYSDNCLTKAGGDRVYNKFAKKYSFIFIFSLELSIFIKLTPMTGTENLGLLLQ